MLSNSINRNIGKLIKLEENGKYTIGFGKKFSIIGFTKNNEVILDVIDTDKYYYETGYQKQMKRKVNLKNMCFNFERKLFDISNVLGVKEHFDL